MWFLALQLIVVALAAGAYFYRAYLDYIDSEGTRSLCLLHDFVHLYCPGCGGTRAAVALLYGQIGHSLKCNPLTAYLAAGFLALDIRAAVGILRRQPFSLRIPLWYFWVMLAIAVIHCIVRNVLMITVGYDYLGDLVGFWHP
ncbi:MAG: DUF2752 domain-containing protein [Clostridia bacterium]|nr:DUF2752 domain-containing protein [Clostridia bacterium]